MYVTTFYSFKGGVGRSMALVNVGAQLAMAGKRVLLVDFDLEAPSLTSFNLAATESCQAGVVDFVNAYLDTGSAPNVRGFLSEPQLFETGGRLWIMPAGASSDDYQHRLARINWLDLYENRSGYLLMEELKAQWETCLQPDYVLIDSRTGHSDVSGICTRQLPDAVAFVFVPNRQNLDGLVRTVNQVRAATRGDGARSIEQFYIESNVPYYDDERRTLETNRRAFLGRLGIQEFNATLHQHPHLSVLNQSVFVQEFPDTSLAVEYRELTETLRSRNLGDRDAVLPQLKLMARDLRFSPNRSHARTKLEKISEIHGNDAEVCFWLGRISRQLGEDEEALIQFNQAIDHGFKGPEVFLERASVRLQSKTEADASGAEQDLHAALRLLADQPKPGDIHFALRSLLLLRPDKAREYAEIPALQSLQIEHKMGITFDLSTSDSGCEFAYAVLRSVPDEIKLAPSNLGNWANAFALACIRTKRFDEAIESLTGATGSVNVDTALAFNRAVALWGRDGVVPVDEFRLTLDRDAASGERPDDPNYLQCIAIAAYVTGDADRSLALAERAKRMAQQRPTTHFSAWRYLKVSPKEFARDCEDMRRQVVSGQALTMPAIQSQLLH